MKEVLDSVFFATHYGAEDPSILERTRAKLSDLRRERRGLIPAVVMAEVANFLCRKAGRREAVSRLRAIEEYGLEIVPLDAAIAREAGLLRCAHRNVPIADCIIAATALRAGGRVVSNDPHFERIKGLRVTWI